MSRANIQVKLGFGSLVALVLSWVTNHSFWWALLHFVFGWFYVAYWVLEYSVLVEHIKRWMVK